MGNELSAHMANVAAALAEQKPQREQRERDAAEHQRRLDEANQAAAAERLRLQEELQRQQQQRDEEAAAERLRNEARINALADSTKTAQERLRSIQEQLDEPVRDRQARVEWINGLQLQIHQSESLLLVGPKGTGKSTFLWLLKRGEKPQRTTRDGTVSILHIDGFIDSIGLRGWTPEELWKLVVLLIYDGIPQDLIVFTNDRVDLPITTLGLLGINNPMLAIMSSDFWRNLEGQDPRIHITEEERVRRVDALDLVYDLRMYEEIREFNLGIPVTHHDDLLELVRKREAAEVRPFRGLLQELGGQFTVGMENSPNMETLFRFIYIYEKVYQRDRLRFMNHATLQEFDQ